MSSLRSDLLESYKKGKLLCTLNEKKYKGRDVRDALPAELANLHNDGLIDIISVFNDLKNDPSQSYNFFLLRRIFEKSLPEITAPIPDVLQCVLYLYRGAGQDMAAYTILDGLANFLIKQPERSYSALEAIENSPDIFSELLSTVISSGSRYDIAHFLSEAIRLSKGDNLELKRRAVFSIGNLNWTGVSNIPESAFAALEDSVQSESDDYILGGAIKSAFQLLKGDFSQEKRITALITNAIEKGEAITLHAASEIIGFHTKDLPNNLSKILFSHLKKVKPENKDTLDIIDYGITQTIESGNHEIALQFVEDYLIKNSKQVDISVFDNAVSAILINRTLINKLLTRWFLHGDRNLCEAIHTITGSHHGDDLLLEIDQTEYEPDNFIHTLFLARKTIGYLFWKPISCASILISLMRNTDNSEALSQIGNLILDPLLLNFPGKTRDFLENQAEHEPDTVKTILNNVLTQLDDYFKTLQEIGNLPALHPSDAQREAHIRHMSRNMAESYKEAESKSLFLNIFSKQVLLYGNKSIDYIHGPASQPQRMETPMKLHSVEMEFPRMDNIDHYGLDHMLRTFRVERFKK